MALLDPSRLYSTLLNTGLHNKDNALHQVIHDLIGALVSLNKQTNTLASSSSSATTNISNVMQLMESSSAFDNFEEFQIPGPPGSLGPAGSTGAQGTPGVSGDRKSTRLNSSHVAISYAVFCLKKK